MQQDKLPTRLDQLSDTDKALVERGVTVEIIESVGVESINIAGRDLNAYYRCDFNDPSKVERVVALVDQDTGELISASIEEVRRLSEMNLKNLDGKEDI